MSLFYKINLVSALRLNADKRKENALNISEKINEKLKLITEKTRLSKRLLLVLFLFAVGLAALIFSELGQGRSDNQMQETTLPARTSASEYVQGLEERLTSIISSIDGAGAPRVMITLESGNEDVYLHNYDYGEDLDEDGVDVSGGEAQKIAIARAMYKDAPFIILDEPNTYIDKRFEAKLYSLLEEINKERAIILVSHDIGTILKNVKTIACVNETVHYHPHTEVPTEWLEEHFGCPIEMLGHGSFPHRVLKCHDHEH